MYHCCLIHLVWLCNTVGCNEPVHAGAQPQPASLLARAICTLCKCLVLPLFPAHLSTISCACQDAIQGIAWTPECGREESATCRTPDLPRYCVGRLSHAASPIPGLVDRAHARGLLVHAYTLRNEARAPACFSLTAILSCQFWPVCTQLPCSLQVHWI